MFGRMLAALRRRGPGTDVLSAEQINLCYETVLGRGADEGGLINCLAFAKAQNINHPHAIAKMIYNSDEFRSRFGTGRTVDIVESAKEIEYEGLILRLPEHDDIYRSIKTSGSYEPYVTRHLFSTVREGDVFMDVGANLGVLSLPVARRVGSRGKVLAFEPSQRNAHFLIKNAILNHLQNVQVFPIGLSDKNGVTLSYVALHTSNKTLIDASIADLQDGMEAIAVVKLDTFLAETQRVDVVKIDVEGFEYKVLRGAVETITRWRPKMYIEYSDAFQRSSSGVHGRDLLTLLCDMDYAPTILHRDREPEDLPQFPKTAVGIIDDAWRKCVARGGTHIDLYWRPAERS